MAFIQCDFYSEILGTRTSLNAVIPLRDESGQEHPREMPEQYPVMFLLHGLHSNYSAWSRYSSVERYANERGLAVVMPDAGRSFYTNMRYGYRYFDFFSQELPEVANRLFPLSRDRSQRFIAGLSMGGYGAFKLALSHPEQYAAAASLSGVLSLTEIEDPDSLLPEWPIIFGDNSKIEHSENDLLNLARRYHERQPFPLSLFQCCGTEDFLYQSNQHFLKNGKELGLDLHYEESSGGHEWQYWDEQIKRVIEWLPIDSGERKTV
jgi:S-formylglutathione hydrolase FrmB